MSLLGVEILKDTNLEHIEKVFGRPELTEYGVDYLEFENKRYAQFFVHHSDGSPISQKENLHLQTWLEKLTLQSNHERLQKLREIQNV